MFKDKAATFELCGIMLTNRGEIVQKVGAKVAALGARLEAREDVPDADNTLESAIYDLESMVKRIKDLRNVLNHGSV